MTDPRSKPWSADELALIERARVDALALGMATTETMPVDIPAARQAVDALYRRAGREPVPVWVVPGPAAAATAVAVWRRASLGDSLRDSLRASLRASLGDSLRASLRDSLRDSLGASLGDSLRASLRDSLGDSLGDSLRDSLGDSLDSLGASLDSLGDSLRASLRDTCFWGSTDLHWITFYRTASRCGVPLTEEQDARLAEFEALAAAGWWLWPHARGAVLLQRPSVLRMEEARPGIWRLHCEDGPALAWPDGWQIHAWHGVQVPAEVIETPAQAIAVERVHGEHNQEIRRVLMARMGYGRYLSLSGAVREQGDDYGDLYRIPLAGGRTLAVVRVVNGTPEPGGEGREDCEQGADGAWYKVYWLRVPSTVRSAHEAVAWTYDVPVEEYQPEVRT